MSTLQDAQMSSRVSSGPDAIKPDYVLIDCLDNRGRVQLRQRLALSGGQRTLTIGRSLNADVTVDDEHCAALHAAIEVTADGRLLARDLGSVNGIVVAGQRHHTASGLLLDDGTLQIGRTRLRVRTSHQSLSPEKPDLMRTASLLILQQPARLAALGAAAVVAQSSYDAWLGAPRDLLAGIITSVGFAFVLVGVWVAVWALLSRVMQDEWRWLRHAAIILGVAAVTIAINGVFDLGWFMTSAAPAGSRGTWIGAIALAVAISLHLMHASGLSIRRAALIGCLVPALLVGGGQWMLSRSNSRDVNHISADLRVYPPSLRLRQATTTADFFAGTSALRQAADAKLRSTPADDAENYE